MPIKGNYKSSNNIKRRGHIEHGQSSSVVQHTTKKERVDGVINEPIKVCDGSYHKDCLGYRSEGETAIADEREELRASYARHRPTK
jgi:hypothetical protein